MLESQPTCAYGQWVLGVLRKHGATYRSQRARTGIPHSTVLGWVQGIPPRPDGVIQFANGMGEDPDEGMVAAGYLRVVKGSETDPDRLAAQLLDTVGDEGDYDPASELTYESVEEGEAYLASGGQLSPEGVRKAKALGHLLRRKLYEKYGMRTEEGE